ncbi:MAG: nuclear transport factor 2 family protein [Dehalococcoidia bacterium]
MAGEETVQRVRQAMEAFNRGDIAAMGEFVHPDFTYIVRGTALVSGVYYGWDAMAGVLARIMELTGGTMTAMPEVILADDDNVLMYQKVTGSRPDGRTYDSHQAYRYRLKDGKIIEGETIPVDQQAFAEFLA